MSVALLGSRLGLLGCGSDRDTHINSDRFPHIGGNDDPNCASDRGTHVSECHRGNAAPDREPNSAWDDYFKLEQRMRHARQRWCAVCSAAVPVFLCL